MKSRMMIPSAGSRPEEHIMAVENDLADIKGIGPKHAAMLKEIGVDSIKELRHRNAARLKEMIETRHGKVIGVSEQTCQGWIDAAKAHATT
jgi:predicted flap endonuclease-1-like 5' DNA nuclease